MKMLAVKCCQQQEAELSLNLKLASCLARSDGKSRLSFLSGISPSEQSEVREKRNEFYANLQFFFHFKTFSMIFLS